MPKTRIGTVDYLNARPLVYGLEKERNVQLVAKSPSELCELLKKGRLDVALVSAIECFRNPDFRMLPDIGVCSEGPIKSVKIYSRGDLSSAQTIALDLSSRSAATLTRLIFWDFFENLEVEFVDIKPTETPDEVDADAVLLIGDAALRANPGERQVTDLGRLWTERTGLPFVYAVWACHKDAATDQILPILMKARDRGLPERPRIAQNAAKQLGLPAAGLTQYLTRNLRYQLGEREIKGLERFRDIAVEHGLCTKHDVPFLGARVQVV